MTYDPYARPPGSGGGNPHAGRPEHGSALPDPYPGAWAPPVHPQHRSTNTLAVVALVMAFVFSPAAIVLGVLARRQIRQTGEDGDGIALAGLIVGSIFTVIGVLVVVAWIVLFVTVVGAAATLPG